MTTDSPNAPPHADRALPTRRGWRLVWWLALGVVLLLAVVAGALSWLAFTPAGNAWLLGRVPGLSVTAPQGLLLGDFDAEQVEMRLPSGERVALQGLRWRGLHWQRSRIAEQWLSMRLDTLEAARIDLHLADKPAAEPAPMKAPTTLRLPVEFELRSLRVGELHAAALGDQPLRDLSTGLHLGAQDGALHRVDQLALSWGKLRAGASLTIGSEAPLVLDATLTAAQDATPDLAAWSSSATLAGPLAAPTLQAMLSAQPAAKRPAQSLELRAGLRPFERWPLGELQARTQGLDLSAFHPAAPVTALSGEATARTTALDQPATVALKFTNAQAGSWNDGRLPVRRIDAELRARPDDPEQLDLLRLAVELGTQAAAAGQMQGRGRWTPSRWSLDTELVEVQPAQLDARAPAMRLSGPLSLSGMGLDAKGAAASTAPSIDVKTALTGQLAGETLGIQVKPRQPREVRLDLDATLNALRIELRGLEARTGGARASASGSLARPALEAPWQLAATVDLVDFDPSPWWPGREDSPWRKGPHRLNAQGKIDLRLPAGDNPAAGLERIAALRGTASLRIDNSMLAGVPLAGQARLSSGEGSLAQASATTSSSIAIGGNRISVEGRFGTRGLVGPNVAAKPTGTGAADQWQIDIDAPTLAKLAPLWRLLGAPGEEVRLAGALKGRASVNGRWPDLRSEGELSAEALQFDAASLPAGEARWRLGNAADAALDLDAKLSSPAWGEQSLESIVLQVAGTGRSHRVELRAESKLLPPAWIDVVQSTLAAGPASPGGPSAIRPAGASTPPAVAAGARPSTAPASTRSVASLRARGGWLARAGQPRAGWSGTLERLELLGNSAQAAPWLRTSDLGLELQWAEGPTRVAVQPGRIEVLGGALRWSRLNWQEAASSGAAQIDVQAEVEPIRVAPILARLQPTFGWGGDLLVGGHIKLRGAPGMTADVVLERQSGDLSVTDETGTQALGLSDLRLALDARDGVWNFTQALAGKTLGIGAGAVVARTAPQATWPDADTPIQGVLELQVENLGTWGTWVPAGWRLGGSLRTGASIGGRFGAPEYTGELKGQRLSVRNFLEGVNVSDGELSVLLQGETARIQQFTMKAGEGRLRLAGSASFGESPQAQLEVEAERFQLLGRVDRRIVTSGKAQLRLDRDALALTGQFGVDEALIDFTRSDAPSLGDDVEVVRARPAAQPAPAENNGKAPAPAPRRKVDLNLRVDLGEQLRLRGRGLDTLLRGTLRITAPEGRLAVNGAVSTAEGRYVAYGQKLTIDRGVVSFNGPVDNPRLNIEAIRPDLEVRVGVAITGTAVNPRVRLFSVPELGEKDKLSWLLLGRPSDTVGGTEAALLQQAAVALLSGEGEGKTDQVIRSIGLDQLSVRQSDGEVRETVISLGKQISRSWYVGYERSLNATAGNWQLIYRVAQRFTLRAQAGFDNSFDAIWSWRW